LFEKALAGRILFGIFPQKWPNVAYLKRLWLAKLCLAYWLWCGLFSCPIC
jgi:hypothetical protein